MMRRIRKFCIACILTVTIGLSTVGLATAEAAYPKPTDDFFVNDFAGLLEPADQAEMQQAGEALYRATKAQVVVVTVDSLEGQSIEEYSIALAREWGIGDAEQDNGVLLLLALEEREVRVEVGSGLEGAITDVGAWQITQHYGIEHFKADEFSAGLTAMYGAIVNEVYLEYGKEPTEEGYVPVEELEESETEQDLPLIRIVLILVIIGLSLAFSRKKRGGGGHGGHGGGLPFFFFMPGGFRGGHKGGFHGGGGFSGGGFRGGGGGFSGGGSSSKF